MQQNPDFKLRLMQHTDISEVFEVQRQAYVADMVESAELLARRLANAPESGWVVEDHLGVAGYLACYPSMYGKISALGQDFMPAVNPDALYLHDLAVAPRMAGRGAAAALLAVAQQWALSQQMRYLCLVSVQNTLQFWQRQGFAALACPDQQQQACLASYSGLAFYCSKSLPG